MERGTAKVTEVKEGTILPARYFSEVFDWGIGGVLDENGDFVEESGMELLHRFGGRYEYEKEACEYFDETVIYLGPVRTHWGHFLAECSVRFWYLLENQGQYRAAFCGLWFGEGKLSPKLIEIFGLLGVGKERLLDIRKPAKFKRVLIPSPLLEYEPYRYGPGKMEQLSINWEKHSSGWRYGGGFQKMYQSIVEKAQPKPYQGAEKLYYTRTGLDKKNEIGERLIEKIFRKNGFLIVSPEKESVETQIALMQTCKEFVSMEGTLAHNIVFAGREVKQTILLKKRGKNALQEQLNQCMGIGAETVYVGCRPFGRKFPRGGWDGIYWVRPGRAFRRWCLSNDMWFPGRLEIWGNDLKNLTAYIRLCLREMKENGKIKREDRQVLKRVKNYDRIVLYGVNARCLRWKNKIERKYPQKSLYWADTNAEAVRKYIQVYGMDDAAAMEDCLCLIGITNRTAAEEVKKTMVQKGAAQKRIYLL